MEEKEMSQRGISVREEIRALQEEKTAVVKEEGSYGYGLLTMSSSGDKLPTMTPRRQLISEEAYRIDCFPRQQAEPLCSAPCPS